MIGRIINKIRKDHIEYDSIEDVVKWADIVSILIPDKVMPQVFNKKIKNYLSKDKTLLFSHGFNIHYKIM